jgi:hypothetical protein
LKGGREKEVGGNALRFLSPGSPSAFSVICPGPNFNSVDKRSLKV